MNFTPEKLEQLRTAYNEAIEKNQEYFIFYGHTLYTEYAKYMIEYLDSQLNA